jgi:hypothetical protein
MYTQGVTDGTASVGETEFAQGCAAMASSGMWGKTRVAAGIISAVGAPDDPRGLTLGAEAVEKALRAHMAAGKVRPSSHSAIYATGGWEPRLPRSHVGSHPYSVYVARGRSAYMAVRMAVRMACGAYSRGRRPELPRSAHIFVRSLAGRSRR